jgi:Spy/CpxP family protein refolding chaperone
MFQNNRILRAVVTCSVLAGLSLFGQVAKGPWWTGDTIKELNLSKDQVAQMRASMQEYRPRLKELRGAVQKAEQDLESVFNSDPVNTQKANEAIEHLVAARADLSRTLSQMGLKLRSVLTLQQWQEVEKRFPPKMPVKAPGTN